MSKENKIEETYKRIKKDYDINLFDKVLELRKFEIENFWKRTLFFWGTIALIYAGYFKANLQDYQIIIPLIGLLFNIIFSLSTRGSKYWQEHWETIATVYENKLNFDLFKHNTKEVIDKTSKSILTKPYRFSVSKLTMLLSDLSVLLWLFLWFKQILELISKEKINFKFGAENTVVDWFTIEIFVIHIILIGYFIVFILTGNVYHSFKKKQK